MTGFDLGAVIPLIIAGVALEAIALAVLYRRTGRGLAPAILLPNLAAGACLMAATGTALRGWGWGWTATLLIAAGLLHVLDVRGRWG